jgi:phage terminase small subunit
MAKLSAKQKAFVDEYIKDLNATQAAIRAGYKEKTARSQGARLLTNANIQGYLQKRMAEKEKKTIADQDEILSFLTSVLRGEVREQVPLLAGNGYQELAQLDEANPKDRIKAAELLGKRYSMWTEKVDVSGDLSVSIQVDYGDDDGDNS